MTGSVISEERVQELRVISDGNDSLLIDLLDKFLTNTRQLLDTCVLDISANNHERIKRTLHTLKGSSLNLGLVKMTDLVVGSYDRAREGVFENLESEVKLMIDHLEEIQKYKATLSA